MIIIKSDNEIEQMRIAGRITAEAIEKAGEHIAPGVTTADLDKIIHDYMIRCGARPSFLKLYGFPASACISVNDEVIHGIPSKRRHLLEGDIVSIDAGACYNGFHGDSTKTFFVGHVADNAAKLVKVTQESFYEGLKYARPGYRIGDIGAAIERYATGFGYTIVRDFVGHGVGRELHEEPEVPNFGTAGRGARLEKGMTIAIEPMINEGIPDVKVSDNDWTVFTVDGKLSAHYEHTVLITDGEPEILTKRSDE
ncbi:MAG: type I methionyl aminopeptidase [Bacillota bacterium]|nr:type I methionyl aminopeptidase [Bacillota bacterium]